MVKAAYKELTLPHIDGMVSINDAANQLRYFLSTIHNDSLVYEINTCPTDIKHSIMAANWIRDYGYPNLTNELFSELVNGIVDIKLTKDDSIISQILTGPEAAIIQQKSCRMFITAEELGNLLSKYDISEDMNNPISKVESGRIKIVNTCLGRYIILKFN